MIVFYMFTLVTHIDEIKPTCLEQDVSNNCEYYIDNVSEILLVNELFQNLVMAVQAKVLSLYFDQFVQMILQLVGPQLIQVVFAQDHVLNQLSNLLIELDNVWLAMDEILNSNPFLEHAIVVCLLRTTSK